MNQDKYLLIALAAILIAAGSAANWPIISTLAVVITFAAVLKGKLWEEQK